MSPTLPRSLFLNLNKEFFILLRILNKEFQNTKIQKKKKKIPNPSIYTTEMVTPAMTPVSAWLCLWQGRAGGSDLGGDWVFNF